MSQTIKSNLFENNQIKQINNSNQQWSLQKENKTVEEQMEYTLTNEDKSKPSGIISSKYPTNIY
ncbi:hypothetical protein [Spiroplasma endosymbiont of Stenodema calcarata]|uniref:hypothetical protein n=1 Tax=Spiroplasma endosymbiont of Stenodema calcarata TaxID=3139328 RepID=UPI003CCA8210